MYWAQPKQTSDHAPGEVDPTQPYVRPHIPVHHETNRGSVLSTNYLRDSSPGIHHASAIAAQNRIRRYAPSLDAVENHLGYCSVIHKSHPAICFSAAQ